MPAVSKQAKSIHLSLSDKILVIMEPGRNASQV